MRPHRPLPASHPLQRPPGGREAGSALHEPLPLALAGDAASRERRQQRVEELRRALLRALSSEAVAAELESFLFSYDLTRHLTALEEDGD